MSRAAARAFRTHIVGPVLRHVAARAGEAAAVALARRCGLPAGAASAAWVEVELTRLHRFLDDAAATAGDALLGIHVGEALPRETWDVLQMSSLSAPTLRSALALLPRLVSLFNDAVEITTGGGRDVTIAHAIPGVPDGLSRHGNELWVAALLRRARESTGAAIRPRAIWFAHRAPDDVAADSRGARAAGGARGARSTAPADSRGARAAAPATGGRDAAGAIARALDVPAPAFGAGATGIEISAADADRPLRTADPVLLAVLDRLVAPQLAALGDRRGVAARVCRALDASLDAGVDGAAGTAQLATMDAVARGLGLSSRTLQRELTGSGTSFRALVDHVRQTRARALLKDDVPVDEVAARLGYSERSAFVRAFGRWSGRDVDAARRG